MADEVRGRARHGAAVPPPKRSIVVVNRTGGQGKTLVSHLIAYLMRREDPDFRVMCADSLDGPGGSSKLGRMLPGVIELGAGPTPDELRSSPSAAMDFWDAVATPLLDRSGSGVVLDVGANLADSLAHWASSSDMGALLAGRVVGDLVVPVVASPKSVSDAREVVAAMLRPGGMPLRAVTLVENAWQGPFGPLADDPDLLEVRRMCAASGGGVAQLPLCHSDLLRAMERLHLPISEVASLDYAGVALRMSLPAAKASRELRAFNEWLGACASSLSDAGLGGVAPPPASPAAPGAAPASSAPDDRAL